MSLYGKHHWSRTGDHARVESDATVAREADDADVTQGAK